MKKLIERLKGVYITREQFWLVVAAGIPAVLLATWLLRVFLAGLFGWSE